MTVTVAHNKFGVATTDVEASTYPSGTGGHLVAISAGRSEASTPVDAGTDDWGAVKGGPTNSGLEDESEVYSRDGDPDDDTWSRRQVSNSEVGVIYLRDDSAAVNPWTAYGNDEFQTTTTPSSPVIAAADINSGDFLSILWITGNGSVGVTTWPTGYTEQVSDSIGSAGWFANEIYVATRYVTGHDDLTDYDPGSITMGGSDTHTVSHFLVETAGGGSVSPPLVTLRPASPRKSFRMQWR